MILMYHGIIPDYYPEEKWCLGQAINISSFKDQIIWLLRHRQIVSLEDYLYHKSKNNDKIGHRLCAITFDDGLKTTFETVFSFLQSKKIPVTIFVTTKHLNNRDILWFSYLNGLCFQEEYREISINNKVLLLNTNLQKINARLLLGKLAFYSGDAVLFCDNIKKRYPLKNDTLSLYRGMTDEQFRIIKNNNIIEIGSHSLSHPFLSQKSRILQEYELIKSKEILEGILDKTIKYFAYPIGDYNIETIKILKMGLYDAALAVISKRLANNPLFEIERTGVYSSSLLKFKLKIMGFAEFARKIRIKIG